MNTGTIYTRLANGECKYFDTEKEKRQYFYQLRKQERHVEKEGVTHYGGGKMYKTRAEAARAYHKAYYAQNKETCLVQQKAHYNENRQRHIELVRKYKVRKRQEKIDAGLLAERVERTPEERKQIRQDLKKEKVLCECGVHYTRSHKAKHIKTKKHEQRIDVRLGEDCNPNLKKQKRKTAGRPGTKEKLFLIPMRHPI